MSTSPSPREGPVPPGGGLPVGSTHSAASGQPAASELAEVEHELEQLAADAPRVGIVVADKADLAAMQPAEEELRSRRILFEVRVMSAYHDPEQVADYARNAQMRGLRVIIAGAAHPAALPGVVAAHTRLPVIAVPLLGPHAVAGGLDALLAAVQVPDGVPVASVGLHAAHNAALLAARILGG